MSTNCANGLMPVELKQIAAEPIIDLEVPSYKRIKMDSNTEERSIIEGKEDSDFSNLFDKIKDEPIENFLSVEMKEGKEDELDLSMERTREATSNLREDQQQQQQQEFPLQPMSDVPFQADILPLLVESPVPAIRWLQQNRLLKCESRCNECDVAMNWTGYHKSPDGFAWKCQNKGCSRFKNTTSIRTASFFAKSRIQLRQWIHVMHCWSEKIGVRIASRQVGLSEKTIIDCYASFRGVSSRFFTENPIQLGGPGVEVDVQENCFSHKQSRGKNPGKPLYVFGIVDTTAEPAIGYLELMEDTSAASLFPIIEKVALPGSIIYSEQWQSYRNVQALETEREPSWNFVKPSEGVRAQLVQSYWNKQKLKIKEMHGCSRRGFLGDYLHEFMWRDRYQSNAFQSLCIHISKQFPF